jgi:1,4-alpha-glucan branching enzyme
MAFSIAKLPNLSQIELTGQSDRHGQDRIPSTKEIAMAIKKQYYKTKTFCKVTFHLSKKKACSARKVAIAGDFNDWKSERTPMKALKNGDFTASVQLAKGREYQYRFVLDDQEWVTDESADKQVYCEFANAHNAVVVV